METLLYPDCAGASKSLARGARAGLRDALRTAQQSVRIIDAFVRTALVDDPRLLTAWKSVKKLNLPSVRLVGHGTQPDPRHVACSRRGVRL